MTPGFPKFGKMSVGVARQYSRRAGEGRELPDRGVDQRGQRERVVPVELAAVCPRGVGRGERVRTSSGARRPSCPRMSITSRSGGWRSEMIDELIGWGLDPPVILGDGAYGDTTELRTAWSSAASTTSSTSRAQPPPTRRTSARAAGTARAADGRRAPATARIPHRSSSWRSTPARRPR